MRNQLSESQPGCPGSFDKRQEDRDKRIITALVTASEKEQADKDLKKDLEERRKSEVESSEVTAGAEVEDSTQDKDYNVGRLRQKEKRKICLSSDRVNVSYRARAMIAASTINAMGGNIDDTNVSKTSAWRKSRQGRTEPAAQVKDTFKCPAKVTAHWDGKSLNLIGNTKSNRISVYLAGAYSEMDRKLLGVPETPSGTGAA